MPGASPYPDIEAIRRAKIRAAALERHHQAKDPLTGKSALAVEACRRGGIAVAYGHVGGPGAWSTRLYIARLQKRRGAHDHQSGASSASNPTKKSLHLLRRTRSTQRGSSEIRNTNGPQAI